MPIQRIGTVWNIDAAGSGNGGAGFDSSLGGTDYSLQASPQISPTDLATPGIGSTTLTSASNPFTAAMVGNVFNLVSGTNLTVGRYMIVAYVSAGQVTLDRAPDDGVGGLSGVTGHLGGAYDKYDSTLYSAGYKGNKVYVKEGSYTASADITLTTATSADHVQTWGYKTTHGDNPAEADMPNITLGAYRIISSQYQEVGYLKGTYTGTNGALNGTATIMHFFNCSFEKITASAASYIYRTGNNSSLIGCKGIVSAGSSLYGCNMGGSSSHAMGNYIKGATRGLYQGIIDFNILSDCTAYGVYSIDQSHIQNNILYNNATGVEDAATGNNNAIMFNDFVDNTIGLNSGGSYRTPNDWNNYYNNGTDIVGETGGDHDTANDPNYTDAANGDFNNDLTADTNLIMATLMNIRQGAVQQSANGGVQVGYVGC